jgi:hypothetical protein
MRATTSLSVCQVLGRQRCNKQRLGGVGGLRTSPCRAANGDPGALHFSHALPTEGEAQRPNMLVEERSSMHSQAEFSGCAFCLHLTGVIVAFKNTLLSTVLVRALM